MKMRSILVGGALLALVLTAGDAARAEGRITFTKMTVTGCASIRKCIWKLSCQVGAKGQVEKDMRGSSRDAQDIGKSFDVQTFPVAVQCSLQIDDGWIFTSWEQVGKASVPVPGGGDWDLEMENKEYGGASVHVTVDSLEVGAPPAEPAAAPKAPARKAAKPAPPKAPRQFVAVYHNQDEGEAVLVGMTWDELEARSDQLDAQGSRIISLDTYVDGDRRLWSAIFRSSKEKQHLVPHLSPEDFNKTYRDMVVNHHMRLVDVVVYDEGGKRWVGGAFREGYDNPALWFGQEQRAFEGKIAELGGQGLRVVRMEVYRAAGNKLNYAGAFREGTGSYGIWTGLDHDALLAKLSREGHTQINEVKTYVEGKKRLYDAVIGAGVRTSRVFLDLDWAAFAAKWKEQAAKGMRLAGFDTYQE
jgi:Polyglycine hydrolase-like, structural repeat